MSTATSAAAGVLALLTSIGAAQSVSLDIRSNATWRATSVLPSSGWNSSTTYDDSDAAGWEFAFKSPAGNNIWIDSNLSVDAPDQAWFRYVFVLSGPVTSADGLFNFDDNGEAYINGTLIVADGPDTTAETLQLSPTLFRVGPNVVAVHGIDTHTPFNNIAVRMTVVSVPEPSTFSIAFCGLLFRRWRLKPQE